MFPEQPTQPAYSPRPALRDAFEFGTAPPGANLRHAAPSASCFLRNLRLHMAFRNRIKANTVTGNDRGIVVDSTASLIIRNSASVNTINYVIVTNNSYGIIRLAGLARR